MVNSLNKRWKEVLFAFSGFGPNFLMVVLGAYFSDAINPSALLGGSSQAIEQTIAGMCLISPAIFPILWFFAKAFDGIIDIPFASVTDTLKTKWGRRRPPILICFVPMVVSFAMCWMTFGVEGGAIDESMMLFNTIWVFFWALIFFASYTMCMISFYGSLSTVCKTTDQRMRVSSFKAFFDTISYCIAYALVPIILSGLFGAFGMQIDGFVLMCLPLMLTMIIPLIMIKEGEKYGYPERQEPDEKPVRIIESIKLTFGNRLFVKWLIVNCLSFFGLQMFLTSMNALILGSMGLDALSMTILNTFAFAPVPIMLFLFNKVKMKKGTRFVFQTSLLAFAVAILSFDIGSVYFMGADNKMLQMIIGCVGSIIASWSIGSFFMMPYAIPAQISSVEQRLTGKNHSAMYFAAQAIGTSIIGAVASALVYENIKMLFISKDAAGIVYADSVADAAALFGVDASSVFNFGTLIVPIIVSAACLIGFFAAFTMPKDFSPILIARELKKQYPELDISAIEMENEGRDSAHDGNIVKIVISVLSGFVFNFVWIGFMLSELKRVSQDKRNTILSYLLCAFVPFYSIYWAVKTDKVIKAAYEARGMTYTSNMLPVIISCAVFPVLSANILALPMLQSKINKLLEHDFAAEKQARCNDEAGCVKA